jgi:hypothetical protein
MSGRTGRVAGILSTAAAAALVVTALDAGVAQAGGVEQVEVLRPTAVLANLDASIPPVVTTLNPGRDVAFPACRKADTDMVWIRFGAPDTQAAGRGLDLRPEPGPPPPAGSVLTCVR